MSRNVRLYICLFLSGVAALTYEVVWARMLTTVFGASLYAVATVTAVFLGGLALGAFIAAKPKWEKTELALSVYAAIEVAVGGLGIAMPSLVSSGWISQLWLGLQQSLPGPEISYIARALFACVLLLPPTILMGATLPVVMRALESKTRHGETAQLLYACNTAGGALGAILVGFLVLPQLGLTKASVLAAALNLFAAMIGLFSKNPRNELYVPVPPPTRWSVPPPPPAMSTLYMVSFLSGLLLLSSEICWTRWFSLVLGSSVYSLSIVLSVFLVSLACGAWATSSILQRWGNPLLLMASAMFLSSTYILITLYAANEIPWVFISLCQSIANNGQSFAGLLVARVFVVSLLIAPPVMLMGTVLPLVLGSRPGAATPQFVGMVYAVNTCGCILGALITGFFLIPSLSALAGSGIEWTFLLSIAAEMLVALWLFYRWSSSFVTDPDTRSIVVGIAVFVASGVIIDVAFFRPEWNPAIVSVGPSFFTSQEIAKMDRDSFLAAVGALPNDGQQGAANVLFYREGLNATVLVAKDAVRHVTYLRTDGKVEAAIPSNPAVLAKGADTTTHLLLGALPPAMVSRKDLHLLVIGYGSGTTSGAGLTNPRVSELTIAELEPAVYAADRHFIQSNGNPLHSIENPKAKVNAIVNDGRYVLAATADGAYDAIICQPSDPWVSGASELFTTNFWQLARTKLKSDGIIAQWVQMYSISPKNFAIIVRSFASVFPNCALVYPESSGECILLGTSNPQELTPQVIKASLTQENSSAQGPANYNAIPAILQTALILGPQEVKALCEKVAIQHGGPLLNTDDRNLIEFGAGRQAIEQRQQIDENVQLLRSSQRKAL